MHPRRIGVVIPYFQRQAGLLRTAVDSILAQSALVNGQCTVQIVVVDDASPIPASQDLEGLVLPAGVDLLVHRQPNGGAGAARNAAIDRVDPACGILAFLDSDDVWSTEHLSRALHALAAGADFYFCDAVRGDDEPSLNADAPDWFRSAFEPVPGASELHRYTGTIDKVIVNGLVPTTSTIVHRRHSDQLARFPSRYFRFGEDQYYCLQLLSAQGKMAYSSAVEVRCGRGVNIFAGNLPGSEGQLLCFLDEIAFRKDALATLSLSSDARRHVRRKLREAKRKVLQQGLWMARDDRGRWLRRSFAAHRSLIASLPAAFASVLADRLCGPSISDSNRGGQ